MIIWPAESCIIGYSDYDVFLESDKVHWYIGIKSYSKKLL